MPNVYTPHTLSKEWGCSENHIRNLIRRGELTAFRLGGKLLRIRSEDVEAYRERNSTSHDFDDLKEEPERKRQENKANADIEARIARIIQKNAKGGPAEAPKRKQRAARLDIIRWP